MKSLPVANLWQFWPAKISRHMVWVHCSASVWLVHGSPHIHPMSLMWWMFSGLPRLPLLAIPLPCIVVSANQRTKHGLQLGTGAHWVMGYNWEWGCNFLVKFNIGSHYTLQYWYSTCGFVNYGAWKSCDIPEYWSQELSVWVGANISW